MNITTTWDAPTVLPGKYRADITAPIAVLPTRLVMNWVGMGECAPRDSIVRTVLNGCGFLAQVMDDGTYTIVVAEPIADMMEKQHVDAVLLHEMGHVHHGHKTPPDAEADLVNEIEADAYAAAIVGGSVMADALVAVIKASCEFAVGLGKTPRSPFEDVLATPHVAARLAALRK